MQEGGRKRIVIYLMLATLGLGWVSWFPLHSRLTQAVFLVCLAVIAFLSIMLAPMDGRANLAKMSLLGFAGFVGSLFFSGRPLDAESFQKSLVKNLEAQTGRSYYWGGESVSGVDCSGLPRRAFRTTCWETINPALWRNAIDNWLFDASARAMQEGYRGRTVSVGLPVMAITEIDHTQLELGDMAVTDNGVHMLVYLGDY
ncbi:MAG: C40 family peptidase [Verrucomicrobiae bacterium]|nr:C40 family peptidase [Verrucomicrobiae bacterium]